MFEPILYILEVVTNLSPPKVTLNLFLYVMWMHPFSLSGEGGNQCAPQSGLNHCSSFGSSLSLVFAAEPKGTKAQQNCQLCRLHGAGVEPMFPGSGTETELLLAVVGVNLCTLEVDN